MSIAFPASPVVWIEVWHGLLILALLLLLVPLRLLEPYALLIGGLFMGGNFLLLSYGIRLVLTPAATKGRVHLGVFLLLLKFALFLGSMVAVFLKVHLDAISFAVGVSSLLAAIMIQALWPFLRE